MTTVHYDSKTALLAPIEVRLTRARPGLYVLVCWVTPAGTVDYSLTINGSGQAEALSNLQSTGVFPRKAVAGWQADVLSFVEHSIYRVESVR